MTIEDLFESGMHVQGRIVIQCWDDDYNRIVFYDGLACDFYPEENEELSSRTVAYMFAEDDALCIELADY